MKPDDFARFKVNNFDLIRLFAAVEVLIFHTFDRFQIAVPAWLEPLHMLTGVPIFFVVSGFLVSASYERSSSLSTYARARALRIFPGLWACVAITAIIAIALGFPLIAPSGAIWFAAQLVGLIYTPGTLDDFGIGSYNGSLWTIPIELQFYIILPFLYAITRRLKQPIVGWLVIFAVCLSATLLLDLFFGRSADGDYHGVAKMLQYTFSRHVYLFVFGIILQRTGIYKSKFIAGKALWWFVILVAMDYIAPESVIYKLFLGVFAISFAYTVTHLGEKVIRGQDISYGIYIYHGLVINLLIEAGVRASALNVLYVAVIAICFAGLSWRFIEQPAIRRKKRANPMAAHVW